MMKLKTSRINFEAHKPIAILNREDAADIDVLALERIYLKKGSKDIIAIVNLSSSVVRKGEIGLSLKAQQELGIKKPTLISCAPAIPPASIEYIKKRMEGQELSYDEIKAIIEDTVEHRLSDIELTGFVTSFLQKEMTIDEACYISEAMIGTSDHLRLGRGKIYDKHSIGGVPGDKTSILVVPIIASFGLRIPKTSSRAITSPAGTADRFECIAPVNLSIKEIEKVVKKTGACLVWGGAVDLAPADDIFIKIEYPFSIDPFLLPSVMSKKKAAGAKYLVIDVPTGKETKIKTMKEYNKISNGFVELGKRLGIKVKTLSTFGDQPLGRAVGASLEAKEALETLRWENPQIDLVEKACAVAGVLLEFAGYKNGKKKAMKALESGQAYRKLQEIIKAQGGDPDITPGDIRPGKYSVKVKSNASGIVEWISTKTVAALSREAGSPTDKGAGIYFHRKLREDVKKGDILFEVFSEKKYKLQRAMKFLEKEQVMNIDTKFDMVLDSYPHGSRDKSRFILER